MASKGIGFWSSCQLLINNTVGPALVLLPSLFQDFGYFLVIFILLIVSILSILSALMLSQTLNHYITIKQKNRSYSELDDEQEEIGITLYHMMQQYISNKFILKSILSIYSIALILRLMAAIIQSGQIIDFGIRDLFARTCALGFSTKDLAIICSKLPFEPTVYIFSFGFILLIIICIILFKSINFDNIDDSIILQWFANIVVVILLCIWLHIFWTETQFNHKRLLFFGHNSSISHCISIICANYAFIIPIPSWYTQKNKNINYKNGKIHKIFIYSIVFVFILFVLIGMFGGMAYSKETYNKYNDNLFTVLNESKNAGVLGKLSVYAFPIAQNITTIPVLCIIIAYNLKNFGIKYKNALIISSISPWIMSLLFFNGDGFNIICDWTSIFITIINFILPPILFILMKKTRSQIIDSTPYSTNNEDGFLLNSHDDVEENNNKSIQLPFHQRTDILDRKPIQIAYAMIITSSLLCIIIVYDKIFLH